MGVGIGYEGTSSSSSAADDELRKLVDDLRIQTTIMGCGGGGSNTVSRLAQVGVEDATLVAANSDARHLLSISAPHRLILGKETTRGLGAGSMPQVGRRAAEEAQEEIRGLLQGRHIVFITAGLGGGTGTGAAPYVAELARLWSSAWSLSRSRRRGRFERTMRCEGWRSSAGTATPPSRS